MPLQDNALENERLVPLTDYVGSFMAAVFNANPDVSSKVKPNSSRMIDTVEFTTMHLIDGNKLVSVADCAVLPNKPDLRISDLSLFSTLQSSEADSGNEI